MATRGAGRTPGAASEPALGGLRIALVGPGRVGRSFALWCRAAGARPELVVVRRAGAGAAARYGLDRLALADVPLHGLPGLPDALEDEPPIRATIRAIDLWLLTVSDGALPSVASTLAQVLTAALADAEGREPPVALHAAGCLDATVLAPLADAGVATGSLHPLRAFADVMPAPDPSAFFAVDGAPAAVALARRLVAAWGGRCAELEGDRRVAYHLAATLAAGGVATVLASMAELMHDHALPVDLFAPYLDLMRGAVEQVEAAARDGDAGGAITGPAARGDAATLERHLRAVRSRSPHLEPFLRAVWSETARQVARGHPDSGRRFPDGPSDPPLAADPDPS